MIQLNLKSLTNERRYAFNHCRVSERDYQLIDRIFANLYIVVDSPKKCEPEQQIDFALTGFESIKDARLKRYFDDVVRPAFLDDYETLCEFEQESREYRDYESLSQIDEHRKDLRQWLVRVFDLDRLSGL